MYQVPSQQREQGLDSSTGWPPQGNLQPASSLIPVLLSVFLLMPIQDCLPFGLKQEYTSCMQHLTLPIIVEGDSEGYFVTCPALQGCYSQGETYEEAIANIKDAIRLHVEDRLANGEEIPQPSSVILSTVEIAV
jgi:predicted RNase H-like HicB family nuclease